MFKKVREFYLNWTIKTKLILAFVFVAILIISVVSLIYYNYMKKEVLLRTERVLENNISVMENQVSQLFTEMDSYAELIAGDPEIQEIIKETDTYALKEYINANNTMKIGLNHMTGTNESIEAVIVYTLNERGYSSFPFEDESLIEIFYELPYDIEKIGINRRYIIDEEIHKPYIRYDGIIVFQYDMHDKHTGDHIGYLNFIIEQKTLTNFFSQFTTHENDEIGIVDSKENEIVVFPYKTGQEKHLTTKFDEITYSDNTLQMKVRLDSDWILYQKMSMESMELELRNLVIITVLLAVIVLGLLALFSNWLVSISLHPLHILQNAMINVSKGDMKTKVYLRNKDEIGSLADNFNHMIEQTDTLMKQLVDEQKEKRKYEYQLIQAQINPHFLYNTLETICGLAELGEDSLILDMVEAMNTFYRKMLNNGDNIIGLEDEILIVKSYMDIFKIRFPNKFSYKIDIPDELKMTKCLKLTLQPIVENAIIHAFEGMSEGGNIQISAERNDDKVFIRVKDNGCGIEQAVVDRMSDINAGKQKDSFGIWSIEKRIKLNFGEEYGLNINSSKQTGTIVEVKIPYMN